jgi:hypothetical protein
MSWLQAALAFALVMLVLSTIVTILLEGCYRVFQVRESGFRLMMERIFDDVLKPRVGHALRGVTVDEARERFLDAVTHNQGYSGKTNPLRAAFAQSANLKSMTMMQFADRLADTDVGKAIARTGEQHIENFINDLSQKFERFGEASSQRFKAQAQFWCVCVSLALAFVANVDAVRLFQDLVRNQELTGAVIAQYGGLVEEGAERPSSVEETFKSVDYLREQNLLTDEEVVRFKESFADSRLKLVELKSVGLPITIESWPFCAGKAGATGRDSAPNGSAPISGRVPSDSKCNGEVSALGPRLDIWISDWDQVATRIWSAAGLAWFLSVVLAGLLIGLGAPFWFDLARGITYSAQLLGAARRADSTEKPPPAPTTGTSPPPRTPVEAFKVAVAAQRPVRRRALLAADGKPARGG